MNSNHKNSTLPETSAGITQIKMKPRVQTYAGGERKCTQEEQNKVDDEKRREAMKELVASWMERLQLISLITTFFASTEAVLLGITTRDRTNQSSIEEATNAALLGALVLHTSAAIVSFLAAFFLVNYKVHEAKKEEVKAEGGTLVESPVNIFDVAVGPGLHSSNVFETNPILVNKVGDNLIWSSNPHLVQVGPFHGQPPTDVLARCHSLSVLLASLGFTLAMVGIGCFAWGRHPTSVGIFCTIWIGISVMLGVGILVTPDIKLDEWRTPRRIGRVLRSKV